MKKTALILVLALFSIIGLQAQQEETLFGDSGAWFSGIWFGPKYNFSYFEDDFAYVRGGTFGFEFGKTVLIGWSGTEFRDDVQIEGINNTFRLKYSAFMLNVYPNARKSIHPMFGVQTGGGRLRLDDGDRDRVFIVQPSAGLEANIFQWFRFGVEGGYRFVTGANIEGIENSDISAPYAQINLKFGFSW